MPTVVDYGRIGDRHVERLDVRDHEQVALHRLRRIGDGDHPAGTAER
ncbi:hypothetical protein [Burkholderia pyrrocinia]|nr:hypothetical protein [Burkholderia pyrrocinia]